MDKLLPLALAAPLFLGFLVLPWWAWREAMPMADGRRTERIAAAVIVAGLYAAVAGSGTAQALWTAWSVPSGGANRLLPVLWAVFSLPGWALALIVWPEAAWRALHGLGAATAWRAGECRTLGWVLLGAAGAAASATGLVLARPG
jgi:hypothetical protein